tara:strand:+ start:6516 stop:7571 length:1056 start_codon:yes stop_codon:yes gene_type:complete
MPLTQVSSRLIEDTLRYVLGASGTDHYTFTGKGLTGAVNDPTLTLSRGHTYIFENRNSANAHPFYIKTSIANGGTNDAYNTGVTNNGGAGGTEIIFTVPHDAPDLLYYQCSSHSSMAGQLKIAGAVTDGSITEAKLADDAVTADKLANSINTAIAANTAKTSNATHTGDVTGSTSLTIADDAVTNAKIADNAIQTENILDQQVTLAKLEHGTSSNDGKFLRANNGADPTFETISIPSSFVTGMIIMWNSTVASIPSGWVLCDGNNSTPDLRDKFIVGAKQDDSGTAKTNVTGSLLQTGGSNSTTTSIGNSAGGAYIWTTANQYQLGVQKIDHTHTADIVPPFYALCFIMKT